MIRVVVLLIGVFLIWVLFFSWMSKKKKIYLTVTCVALCVAALILDSYRDSPRNGIVQVSQIELCGVQAKHSYRTNFDVDICMKNIADLGTVKRIQYEIIAQSCDAAGQCEEIQRVKRDRQAEISNSQQVTISDNVSMTKVNPDSANHWKVDVLSLQATP